MDEEIFKLKTACLFHDPTIKPLIWNVRGEEGHEKFAYEIITNNTIGLNRKLPNNLTIDESIVAHYAIKHSDWVASSSDRLIISELYKGLIKDIYSVNLLSMYAINIGEKLTNYYPYDKLIENYKLNFINTIFKSIDPSKFADKPHIIYHVIWRFLIDATVESLYNIKEASLLPADTRVPYYTIYDHLYTASGFIPTLKDDPEVGKIGIIHWESIGVQSFIQESRAFRDLWASSFLVSLMNTAVIIRLAKEYGFDSILSPNMLYNSLVDLYLYAHTNYERLKVSFDELRIPTTPDKGFAIVPYDKVDYYVKYIPKLFKELWQKITETVKAYIQDKLRDCYNNIYQDSLKEWIGKREIKDLIYSNEELTFDNIWNICNENIPLNFVCVGEKFSLDEASNDSIEKKIYDWKELYKDIIDDKSIQEINKLRQIARTRYSSAKNFQFFELPIVMDLLKKKRKLVSELPRPNIAEWILKDQMHVKDRRLICNVCYKRPAVIFASNKVGNKLPMIKENERLCPVCLTKRLLATKDVFIKALNNVLNHVDEADYSKVLEEILGNFNNILKNMHDEDDILDKILINISKENPLLIPSLDTISTFSARYSYIKYLDSEDTKVLRDIIYNIAGNDITHLVINAPYIEWFKHIEKHVLEKCKGFLVCIGGEYLIPEELMKDRLYEKKGAEIEKLNYCIKDLENKLLVKTPYNYSMLTISPGKYVSIIRADGDNMGKLFSLSEPFEKRIKDILPKALERYLKDDQTVFENTLIKVEELKELRYRITPSFYAYISRALAIIAKKVAELAKDYATVVVYAGGDDILAIAPVELSLIFASKARELFSEEQLELNVNHYTKILLTGLGNKATQSFAIRYFHVFSPLANELKESNKDLEDKAKEINGKDGLVITYNARSGNIIYSILRWNYNSISEKVFNLVSLTLKYKRLARDRFTRVENISDLNSRLSDSAFRDIIRITNKNYNYDILNTIVKHELDKHSNNLTDKLMVIISCLDDYAEIKTKRYPALLELIKASLAFHNALDSKPLALGVRL